MRGWRKKERNGSKTAKGWEQEREYLEMGEGASKSARRTVNEGSKKMANFASA